MTFKRGYIRHATADFTATFTGNDGMELFRAVQMPRELRMTLPPDQRWPDFAKRGRHIDTEMGFGDDVYRLAGRVRFRRLNVLVIEGTMTRV